MIRITYSKILTQDNKTYIEAAGLSTDTKPLRNIATGSLFFEVDSGDVYAFAEGDSPGWN